MFKEKMNNTARLFISIMLSCMAALHFMKTYAMDPDPRMNPDSHSDCICRSYSSYRNKLCGIITNANNDVDVVINYIHDNAPKDLPERVYPYRTSPVHNITDRDWTYEDFIRVINALRSSGENIDLPCWGNDERLTPFLLAVIFGNVPAVSALLDSDIDPNQSDATGRNAMSRAVSIENPNDRYKILTCLVSLLKSPFEPDLEGNTPLHWAAQRNNEDTIKFMLLHGAEKYAKNKNGETPLDLAKRNGCCINIVNLLSDSQEDTCKDKNGEIPPTLTSGDSNKNALGLS